MVKRITIVLFILTCGMTAQAHSIWCDGTKVAPEVKASCCGKADAHQVPIDAAREIDNGDFMVRLNDGTEVKVDRLKVSPSPDGCTWIWYTRTDSSSSPIIYCFMIPMGI